MMLHGKYSADRGPDKRLWFKDALLMQDPANEDNYLAQFDALHLPEAFGWHPFPKSYFVNLVELSATAFDKLPISEGEKQ